MCTVPAELRYKLAQMTATCPTKDMTKAMYHTFGEFQASLCEKEILHPSEEYQRQRWLLSEPGIFDFINSYHIFCRLCKKHFYSRSVPADINSFFQVHINNEYHLEFRDSHFSHLKPMFTWEEKWRTGKCNVCQMSGLHAFVLDRTRNPKKLLSEHYCVWGFPTDKSNKEFLRKMSLLKKYCQLSIFRDKFIKPLDEGSACLICCSTIPWSGEKVKIHLGSSSHMNRFFWMVGKQHNLSPKELLNGFNLEMVTRWIYCCIVTPTEEFQSAYEKKRLECYLTSRDSLSFDFSPSSGHYCPNLIEDLLACWPSDFIQGNMCLLCDHPIVKKGCRKNHFKSEDHRSKLENLSEESFGNLDNYKKFCANREYRLQPHAKTIEKYKQLKENTHLHLLSLKVKVENDEQTHVRKLFFKKLSLVKKPPSKFLNREYVCEVCDLHISASTADNHGTEFVHLYYRKRWEELEKYAANKRFFEPFQKIRNCIVCLLCGISAKRSNFFSHLKSTLHTRNFEWYCTLKNGIPIFSAIKVRHDLSVVCYLCDSLLLKRMNMICFKTNLPSLRKHWPCPAINEPREETKESLRINIEGTCATCGYNQGAHENDCTTNCLNFKRIKNAIKGILDGYEVAIFNRVLDKTKYTIYHIELAIRADWKQREEAPCECEKSSSQCKCDNLNTNLPQLGAVEKKYQKIETGYLKNDETDRAEILEENEQEISVIPGLLRPEILESKLVKFGKTHALQYEGSPVKVAEQGVAEEAADTNLFPMNDPAATMSAQLRKISEKENEESHDAILEILERNDFVLEKSNLPPLPSDLIELLGQPSRLFKFVENLAAAAAEASTMEIKRENRLCATINRAVRQIFPQCKCYPFGSRLSGLMFSNSDLDVFLDCGGMYRGMEDMIPSAEKKLIQDVAKVLRKTQEITKLIVIHRARVPIISFLHRPTDIRCDLSFKNALGVRNTLLIKFLMSLDQRVKLIIIFFKYWVKQNAIHGQPFFSSYAITMMAIFYLQQLKPPLIPTVEELQNAFVGRRLTVEGWDCSFNENAEAFMKKSNNLPLHVILQGLFSYYANFDYVKFAISPLDGKTLPREAFSCGSVVKLPMCYKRHILNFPHPLEKLVSQKIPVCVIDPFDLGHILTKSITPTGLLMFKHFCHLSAQALQKGTFISNLISDR